jgi:hypothetical protein
MLKIHILLLSALCTLPAQTISQHAAVYDANGALRAWSGWNDILDREMNYYLAAPLDHGYPIFATLTFMQGDYTPRENRLDFIPAMQNGMGVISYLKYYAYTGRKNPRILEFARLQANYVMEQALTPDNGVYPRFPRSTGIRQRFPQKPDCGSQRDLPYEIQPDKAAIFAYSTVLLYEETHEQRYLDFARHVGRVLVQHMDEGTAWRSPLPFRADYRTGEVRGPVSANMSFVLRLFDKLIEHGGTEFAAPRATLWKWIDEFQIPSAKGDARLWVQFFEDYDLLDNRNAWSPLNLARYLCEKKEALDPDWAAHSRTLIEFVLGRFTSVRFGVLVCGEQDGDRNPWGGVLSNFGGALAVYTKATGSNEYKGLAHQALTVGLYATGANGGPAESILRNTPGGWQEDAHTDKIHNYVDALNAFPEWGK